MLHTNGENENNLTKLGTGKVDSEGENSFSNKEPGMSGNELATVRRENT